MRAKLLFSRVMAFFVRNGGREGLRVITALCQKSEKLQLSTTNYQYDICNFKRGSDGKILVGHAFQQIVLS